MRHPTPVANPEGDGRIQDTLAKDVETLDPEIALWACLFTGADPFHA